MLSNRSLPSGSAVRLWAGALALCLLTGLTTRPAYGETSSSWSAGAKYGYSAGAVFNYDTADQSTTITIGIRTMRTLPEGGTTISQIPVLDIQQETCDTATDQDVLLSFSSTNSKPWPLGNVYADLSFAYVLANPSPQWLVHGVERRFQGCKQPQPGAISTVDLGDHLVNSMGLEWHGTGLMQRGQPLQPRVGASIVHGCGTLGATDVLYKDASGPGGTMYGTLEAPALPLRAPIPTTWSGAERASIINSYDGFTIGPANDCLAGVS